MQINLHSGQVPKNTEEMRRKGQPPAERKTEAAPPPAVPLARIESPAAAAGLLAALKGDFSAGGFSGDLLFANADGLRVMGLLDPGTPGA